MAGQLLGEEKSFRWATIAGSDTLATQRAGQPAEVDMAACHEQHRRIHAGRTHVPMIFIPATEWTPPPER